MMRTLHICLYGLVILFLQSCGKGNCLFKPNTNYYYLAEDVKNQTPYFNNNAFDTISFSSDKGDTVVFIKFKTETIWYEALGVGNPDCGYDKDNYETQHNIYTTTKGNGNFDTKLIKKNNLGFMDDIEIIVLNNKFHIDYYWFKENSSYKYKRGTITINNKTYDNTIYVYTTYGDTLSNSITVNKEVGGSNSISG